MYRYKHLAIYRYPDICIVLMPITDVNTDVLHASISHLTYHLLSQILNGKYIITSHNYTVFRKKVAS